MESTDFMMDLGDICLRWIVTNIRSYCIVYTIYGPEKSAVKIIEKVLEHTISLYVKECTQDRKLRASRFL